MTPTAEEFISKYTGSSEGGSFIYGNIENLYSDLKEFAKLHVKAALEAASKKVIVHYEGDINKQSILNAYPENNIK